MSAELSPELLEKLAHHEAAAYAALTAALTPNS
jgi:hypothetical protein